MTPKAPPKLTREKLIQYINDPVLFRMEQWVMPPSHMLPQGGLFGEVCQKWQIEKIFKPIDQKQKNGTYQYQLLYNQLPKKFGKTTILSGECINKLLLSPKTAKECYLLGGDKDQAKYLFRHTRDFIRSNPNLENIFTIYSNEIVVPSTEARLTVLSSEAATKQGKSPDFFIFDEFWNQPDRDLWDTMWLGMAAKPYGQGVIITNAGTDEQTICYNIRQMAKGGKFPRFYYFEPQKEELDKLSVPWITDEWVEMERQSLPPNVFRRLRRNEWVGAGDAPFMPEEGWECFKGHLSHKIDCTKNNHYLGLDIGLKKDAAGAVILHRERGKVVVDQVMQWQGSSKMAVPIEEIERYISVALNNFSNLTLVIDPWQAIGTIQKFRNLGVEAIELNFTVQNITKMSKNLYYLFKNMNIELPHHEPLERELKHIQVVEKSYGWRIDHDKGTKSDLTIALGIASLVAVERGTEESEAGELDNDLYFLKKNDVFSSTGNRTFQGNPFLDNDDGESPVAISKTGRVFK